ncbi:PQQ-binding-like beta-propeller repeat protein [Cellulophaga sp. L1A9]|uniref:outer membrane protein assembly factor BamB family protein n=1 Tax=Cellulophaga sp. L1A9 TaxID=2686362 RepID=UPI00131D92E2|nr:PQQ-binding-like beta-propeller repeat protein [Cellulophaga sp. L1A9]
MKKLILLLFIVTYTNYSFGQEIMAAIESNEPDESNFSNNTILTAEDWLHNTSHKKLTYNTAVKELLLINRYDGTLECYNLNLDRQWSFTPADTLRLSNGGNQFFYKDGVVFTAYMTGYIYAIKATDGTLFWEDKVGMDQEKLHFTSQSLTPVNNKLVLTSRTNSNVYAINASNGTLAWNYSLGSPHSYEPRLIVNDIVSINNDPLINTFELATGKALYQKNFSTNLGKPATDGNLIIVPFSRGDKIVGLLPEAFEQQWEFVFDEEYYKVGDKIFVANNAVYFATETNGDESGIYCLNATDGSLTWKKTIEGDIKHFEKINETLYGYTNDKLIFSMATEDTVLNKIKVNHQPSSNIQIHNGSLYFYAKEGLITYNLKTKTEKIAIPYDGKESYSSDTQLLFIE